MIKRDFDEWLSKFRPSISTYDYYVDFEKVYRNVDEVKVELNILNCRYELIDDILNSLDQSMNLLKIAIDAYTDAM